MDIRKGRHNVRKFKVTVEMQERWIPHFMSMLKHMEYLGNIGSSRTVSFYADGDGDFRPKFSASIAVDTVYPVKEDKGNCTYDAG